MKMDNLFLLSRITEARAKASMIYEMLNVCGDDLLNDDYKHLIEQAKDFTAKANEYQKN